jgi:hypothetical protein
MIVSELYRDILIKPPKHHGFNELSVVSGYASATFANRHLTEVDSFKLNLIIGMPSKRNDHLGFLSLYDKFKGRFQGYYLQGSPPIHSKVYAWQKKNDAIGYSGSANYTQPGFFEREQINQITSDNPNEILDFYKSILSRCVDIRDYDFSDKELDLTPIEFVHVAGSVMPGGIVWEVPNKRVRISFLDRRGNVPQRSGLNWGQRPEVRREPNQAYLSLKGDSRNEGFLPILGDTFTLVTDDNHTMDCVVAQDGRKAIHSTLNNSEIGRYIRTRIGVPLGNPVSLDDLVRYGRTDFTIEKLDEETFFLDLRV